MTSNCPNLPHSRAELQQRRELAAVRKADDVKARKLARMADLHSRQQGVLKRRLEAANSSLTRLKQQGRRTQQAASQRRDAKVALHSSKRRVRLAHTNTRSFGTDT